MDEDFIEKDRFRFLKLLFAILLIVLVCGGGYYYYVKHYTNPKEVLSKSLDSIGNSILTNAHKDVYKVNGYLTFNISSANKDYNDIINILNNLDLQMSSEIDIKNKTMNVLLDSKYKNNALLPINAYMEKNTAYVLLKDIYDKYISINMEEEVFNNDDLTNDDIRVIFKSLIDAFNNYLTEDKITVKEDTITIDEKKYNVDNNILKIDNSEYKILIDTIYN